MATKKKPANKRLAMLFGLSGLFLTASAVLYIGGLSIETDTQHKQILELQSDVSHQKEIRLLYNEERHTWMHKYMACEEETHALHREMSRYDELINEVVDMKKCKKKRKRRKKKVKK